MKFTLGQQVKIKANANRGTPVGKGVIYLAQFSNNVSGAISYAVRFGTTNQCYTVAETDISELKTQTLYAYMDATEEVHWATKNYSKKELTQFGFTQAVEFNKIIELD
jgi:hypothetical protein